MSDDKPKHKPQKKHTLSEVLQSLQDLIRTDLVTAQGVPSVPAVAASSAQAPPPVTPAEPDSFNEALNKLDEIITHNIIEPVERAKDTPPEALLPEETLEIEWDDTEPAVPPADRETIELASDETTPPEETIEITAAEYPSDEEQHKPRQAANNVVELEIIQIETKMDSDLETIDLDAPEAGADRDDHVIEFEASTADESEAIELTPVADDVAPDTIELAPEAFADAIQTQDAPAPASAMPPPTMEAEVSPQRELFATYIAPPTPLEQRIPPTPIDLPAEPAPSIASSETAASPPPSVPTDNDAADRARETGADTQAEGGHDIPSLTVDFDVTLLSATPDDATVAKTSQAKTPPASAAAPKRTAPEPTKSKPAAPTTSESAAPAPGPPMPVRQGQDKPARPKSAAAPPPTHAPVQQDIPVLQEVANLNAPPSAPLPSAAQARDIAIRVIAKLNIERRKAGEAGLDIKTIEKLQQYLADALNKRTLNKPK